MSYNNFDLTIPGYALTTGFYNGGADESAKASTVGGSAIFETKIRLHYLPSVLVIVIGCIGKEWLRCRIGNRFGKIKSAHLQRLEDTPNMLKIFPSKYMSRDSEYHWLCSLCGASFAEKITFRNHCLQYAVGNCRDQPKCGKCNTVFSDQKCYRQHGSDACQRRCERKRRKCQFCGKVLSSRRNLITHEKAKSCHLFQKPMRSRKDEEDEDEEEPEIINPNLVPQGCMVEVTDSYTPTEANELEVTKGDVLYVFDNCGSLYRWCHNGADSGLVLKSLLIRISDNRLLTKNTTGRCKHCQKPLRGNVYVTRHVQKYPSGNCKKVLATCTKCGKHCNLLLHRPEKCKPRQGSAVLSDSEDEGADSTKRQSISREASSVREEDGGSRSSSTAKSLSRSRNGSATSSKRSRSRSGNPAAKTTGGGQQYITHDGSVESRERSRSKSKSPVKNGDDRSRRESSASRKIRSRSVGSNRSKKSRSRSPSKAKSGCSRSRSRSHSRSSSSLSGSRAKSRSRSKSGPSGSRTKSRSRSRSRSRRSSKSRSRSKSGSRSRASKRIRSSGTFRRSKSRSVSPDQLKKRSAVLSDLEDEGGVDKTPKKRAKKTDSPKNDNHPRETKLNSEWAGPIINISTDFKTMTREERLKCEQKSLASKSPKQWVNHSPLSTSYDADDERDEQLRNRRRRKSKKKLSFVSKVNFSSTKSTETDAPAEYEPKLANRTLNTIDSDHDMFADYDDVISTNDWSREYRTQIRQRDLVRNDVLRAPSEFLDDNLKRTSFNEEEESRERSRSKSRSPVKNGDDRSRRGSSASRKIRSRSVGSNRSKKSRSRSPSKAKSSESEDEGADSTKRQSISREASSVREEDGGSRSSSTAKSLSRSRNGSAASSKRSRSRSGNPAAKTTSGGHQHITHDGSVESRERSGPVWDDCDDQGRTKRNVTQSLFARRPRAAKKNAALPVVDVSQDMFADYQDDKSVEAPTNFLPHVVTPMANAVEDAPDAEAPDAGVEDAPDAEAPDKSVDAIEIISTNANFLRLTHKVVVTSLHNRYPSKFFIQYENFSTINMSKKCELEATKLRKTPTHVYTGSLYLTQLENEWYRVKVFKTNDETAKAFFVDYGLTIEVPRRSLLEMGEQLAQIEPGAKECELYDLDISVECTQDATQIMADFIEGKEIRMYVLKNDHPIQVDLFVKTVYGYKSFRSTMIYLNLAKPCTAHQEAKADDIMSFMDWSDMEYRTQIRQRDLVRNDVFRAKVTHSYSPSEFYVRKNSWQASFAALQQQLTEFCHRDDCPLIYSPHIEMLCAFEMRVSNDSVMWMRGRIDKVAEGHCEIFSVDTGQSSIVPWKNIRYLPQSFCVEQCFAMRCTLDDNLKRTSFNEEATRNFNRTVSDEDEVEVMVGEQIEGCYKVVLNAVNVEVGSLSEDDCDDQGRTKRNVTQSLFARRRNPRAAKKIATLPVVDVSQDMFADYQDDKSVEAPTNFLPHVVTSMANAVEDAPDAGVEDAPDAEAPDADAPDAGVEDAPDAEAPDAGVAAIVKQEVSKFLERKDKKWHCVTCGMKPFSRKEHAERHVKSMHLKALVNKQHKCNICSKSFLRKDVLTQHKKNIHGDSI